MCSEQASAAVLGLFEAYFDRVYCFVRRSVDPAAAEEIVQDVFIKLLSCADIERKQVSVSYLLKIADNMLKRRHRRGERSRELVHELARGMDSRSGGMVAPTSDQEPDDRSVLHAFDRLSPEEQEAVRLIVCEGLSYRDAAASMGVRVSTVNNWKHRGLQRLREQLAPDDDAGPRRDRRGEGAGARSAGSGYRGVGGGRAAERIRADPGVG